MRRSAAALSRVWNTWFVVVLAMTLLIVSLAGPAHPYDRPGTTELITPRVPVLPPNPPCAGCPGSEPTSSMSDDGRYVAFNAMDSDLVEQDINVAWDVFLRDRETDTTEIVSVASNGLQALHVVHPLCSCGSHDPSTSASGRFIAFESDAVNLVPGDTAPDKDVFVHDSRSGETTIVSVTSDGRHAESPLTAHDSSDPAISANGRYVAFTSSADDLVKGDTNGVADVFVHDRKSGETIIVTEGGNGGSSWPSLSGDGKQVAFTSNASNLVEGDTNGGSDVFVRDFTNGKVERVSITSAGKQSEFVWLRITHNSRQISQNGRYVVFESTATDLVPADQAVPHPFGTETDVFVHDRQTGRTERVSVTSAGEEVNGAESLIPAISGDGRWVVFRSSANDLVEGDTGSGTTLQGDNDIFIHDRLTGATERASVTSSGLEASECEFIFAGGAWPDVSVSGRFVSFISSCDNLDPDNRGHAPHGLDVFVRDRGLPLAMELHHELEPTVNAGNTEEKEAGLLQLEDDPADADGSGFQGAELVGTTVAVRPQLADLYVKLDVDRFPMIRGSGVGDISVGNPLLVYGLRLEVGGIQYEVRAGRTPDLVAATTNSFALFRCAGSICTEKVASLRGGYGTVGESIVMSVPLAQLDLKNGGSVVDLRAFSAVGTLEVGATKFLDWVKPRTF